MLIVVFITGLAFASFVSMLVSRIEKSLHSAFEIKKIFGIGKYSRSYCDSCKRKLFWWENIPLLSYIALKGKCFKCHSPISFWYFVTEFFTGTIFVIVFLLWQKGVFLTTSYIGLAIYLLMSLALIFVFILDARTHYILDVSIIILRTLPMSVIF